MQHLGKLLKRHNLTSERVKDPEYTETERADVEKIRNYQRLADKHIGIFVQKIEHAHNQAAKSRLKFKYAESAV